MADEGSGSIGHYRAFPSGSYTFQELMLGLFKYDGLLYSFGALRQLRQCWQVSVNIVWFGDRDRIQAIPSQSIPQALRRVVAVLLAPIPNNFSPPNQRLNHKDHKDRAKIQWQRRGQQSQSQGSSSRARRKGDAERLLLPTPYADKLNTRNKCNMAQLRPHV